MEAVYEHVQENMVAYIAGTVVLLAVIVAFRKHTLPAIFYTIETTIYIVVFHTVFTGMVRFASWFKGQTEIRSAREVAVYTGAFFTPMKEFWKKELYSPEWLYYFEIAAILAIIIIVIRYRPAGYGRKNKYKSAQGTPGGKPGAKKKTSGSLYGSQFGQTRSGQTRSGTGQSRRR